MAFYLFLGTTSTAEAFAVVLRGDFRYPGRRARPDGRAGHLRRRDLPRRPDERADAEGPADRPLCLRSRGAGPGGGTGVGRAFQDPADLRCIQRFRISNNVFGRLSFRRKQANTLAFLLISC